MKNSSNNLGEGHAAKFSLVGTFITEVKGKKEKYGINWVVQFNMENAEYVVHVLAGCLAQVADRLTKDGASKRKAVAA
jgi:hypothetical protein